MFMMDEWSLVAAFAFALRLAITHFILSRLSLLENKHSSSSAMPSESGSWAFAPASFDAVLVLRDFDTRLSSSFELSELEPPEDRRFWPVC